jgi:aminoglycoside phosphotransferase (APT) family kinase protein
MSASTQWADLPARARALIEHLVGARVVGAVNRSGGFSPGFTARLLLAGGRRVFVKAMDAVRWPFEAGMYREEAAIAATLPPSVPAPAFLGCADDRQWVALAFADLDGSLPARPWQPEQLARVVIAAARVATAQVPLRTDHPRLGGWAELTGDAVERLDPWAAGELTRLVGLEAEGLAAARGTALVHFDLHVGNILLGGDRVFFVDWAHARLGSPLVDLVMLLAGAAGDGIDPEPLLAFHTPGAEAEQTAVTGILAAHAGFLTAGAVSPAAPGLEAITAAKASLAVGALCWLRMRLVDEDRRKTRRHGRHR